MMQGTVTVQRVDRIKEVLDLLSIHDDALLRDEDSFWQRVALAIGVAPAEGAIPSARRVLEHLSDWDDDYLFEDGERLSDEAYGELLAQLNQRTNFGERPIQPDERQIELPTDEDDDDTSLANVLYGVGDFRQPDTSTLLKWIYSKDLVVNPEWQRNFVWPLKKQRRFIESVLLGLPIPSVLLFESPQTNKKYVIDGRQRLETLATYCATPEERQALGFIGRHFKTFPKNEPYWREGQPLHEAAGKFFDKLPDLHKRKLMDAPFTVFTFRGLQPRSLYQIFQRYNTGAEKLKAAEIRNAVYQDSKLHRMLWRIAGEAPDRMPYSSEEEQYMAETLKGIMRTKTARYGVYDFIGRALAFTYTDDGKTVAGATNDFMEDYEDKDLDEIRDRFFEAMRTTLRWYQYPLTTPAQNGKFHAFLGTIQLVTAHKALTLIEQKAIHDEAVAGVISKEWSSFAEATLDMKQNSSNFWQRQRDWMRRLELGVG